MRDGLAFLLEREEDFVVSGKAGSVADAWKAIDECVPHVIATDLTLPDGSGIDFVKDLRVRHPDVPVVVISMHDEMLYAERLLRAGAKGYIMKEAASTRVVSSIRKVMDGGIAVSPAVSRRLLAQLAEDKKFAKRAPLERLTDREVEILELIGGGYTASMIADKLGISRRTVNAHRWNIRNRLALAKGESLVRYAVKAFENRDVTA